MQCVIDVELTGRCNDLRTLDGVLQFARIAATSSTETADPVLPQDVNT